MNIGEFFIRLGVKVDQQTLTNFDQSLKKIESGSKGIAWSFTKWTAGIMAGYYALDKVVQKTSQLYVDMYNINKQTGLQQQQMYEVQNIARMVNPNASAQDVLQSLAAVQKNLIAIRYLGQGNLLPYQMMGMPVMGMDAIQVLDMLREKAKEPFFQKQPMLFTTIAEQMGFSKELMNMIYLSDKEYEKIKKTKLVPPEGQKDIQDLRFAFNRFNIQLEYTATNILTQFAPALNELLKMGPSFLGFAEDMGKFVAGFFSLINHAPALKVALFAIAIAIAPITTALAGIALLIQDIMTSLQGGQSLFSSPIKLFVDYLYDRFLILQAIWENMFGDKESISFLLGQISNEGIRKMWEKIFGIGKDVSNKLYEDLPTGEKTYREVFGGRRSFIEALESMWKATPPGQWMESMMKPSQGNNTQSYYNPNVNNTYYITGENSDIVGQSIAENTQKLLQYGYGQVNTGALA